MNIKLEEYHIPPVYIPLLYDNTFIKLLYGSRNSAKTDFACLKKLIRCLTLPYFKCLMVRRVKEAVNASVYSTLKTCAKRNKIDHLFEFNDHRTQIKCRINDNMFLPLGTYEAFGSTGQAKSVDNPTDAIIDEMDELTEDEFTKLVKSIRGSEDMEVVGIFNTNIVDEQHWIFKRFFPPVETFERKDGKHTYIKSKRRNALILHTTYLMNPYVNQQTIDEFEQDKINDPEEYDVAGLGLLKTIKASNLAFKKFKRDIHVKEVVEFNPEALCYLSWDFNRLPHHTVGVWQFGGYDKEKNFYNWNLIKEFCLPDHSVREVQKEINKWLKESNYQHKKIALCCDYSGNTKKDHDTKSDINKIKSEIKAANFEATDRTIVNPSVVHSLDFVNDIFGRKVKIVPNNPKYAGAVLNIQVHPECLFHVADFEKTKTDNEGKILKVKKREPFVEDGINVQRTYQARGHAVDGARYVMTGIFPFEYDLHKSSS